MFGRGLDVKKHTCLSITLVNKEFYPPPLSLSLSLSLTFAIPDIACEHFGAGCGERTLTKLKVEFVGVFDLQAAAAESN